MTPPPTSAKNYDFLKQAPIPRYFYFRLSHQDMQVNSMKHTLAKVVVVGDKM